MFNNQSSTKLNPQALVLKFMREKRKLSLLAIAKKTGLKPKNIDYMEQGLKEVTNEDLHLFLTHYKFSIDIYESLLKLEPLNKTSANHFFIQRKIY